MTRTIACFFILFIFTFNGGFSQEISPKIIADWTFHSNYTLKRNAQNYPGNKIDPPKSRFQRFKTLGEPIYLYEKTPTERIVDIISPEKLPQNQFSVEMWLLNHVNMPVGTLIALRSKKESNEPAWLMGYYGNEALFFTHTKEGGADTLVVPLERGWKKYWGHLVGTYDGNTSKVFINGKLIHSSHAPLGELLIPEDAQVEISGYFDQEPYMKISNLLKSARIYEGALSQVYIQDRFAELQVLVEQGKLFEDVFHFNAGPYLHFATQHSINIMWETDRKASAIIRYGKTLPFDQEIRIEEKAYIQERTIEGLEPGQLYYYEIVAIAEDGTEMSSGTLTFGTAVPDEGAFSFCIIGDTESRPHINHTLGEMIWEERPNFIMHLGDITDGGMEPHKFEWNYEYFSGITPLTSRIPMFPVPGNGEQDLYWYNRYHRLPEPEAYYSFTYGNAEFFMINSNAREELKKGGAQYDWLEKRLAASGAKWKFVSHHHCPISSDENDFGNTWEGKTSTQGDPRFDDLKELYERLDVDVVFYGHVHAYERSWPMKDGQIDKEKGVIYIKSGGAGGHLEDFVPTPTSFSQKLQRGNHFCRVAIHGNTFSFKMYDLEGRLKDFFDIEK